jgi:hypothetical protein
MDKKQKKAIRLKIIQLMDSPNPDYTEIHRLSSMLGVKVKKEKPLKVNKTNWSRVKKTNFHVEPNKYIELRNEKKSMEEIAEYFGCPLNILISEVNILRKNEVIPPGAIPYGRGKKITITKEEYLSKKEQGYTDEKIAKELGFSTRNLFRKRKEWGITLKIKKVSNLILEEEYRALKIQKKTDKEIANIKGMNRCTLQNYKRKWGII